MTRFTTVNFRPVDLQRGVPMWIGLKVINDILVAGLAGIDTYVLRRATRGRHHGTGLFVPFGKSHLACKRSHDSKQEHKTLDGIHICLSLGNAVREYRFAFTLSATAQIPTPVENPEPSNSRFVQQIETAENRGLRRLIARRPRMRVGPTPCSRLMRLFSTGRARTYEFLQQVKT